ncbi:MAG: hydrogenase/urease accessory protein HupE [Paracrocinitomix sp.]|jgi:hydrogenase/urease accessory protein HupE
MKQIFARISWIWVVIGWTFFLWLSRLRNVVTNDEFSSSARSIRIGIVVVFVTLAAVAVVAVRRRWPKVLALFLAWTVGYWLVRGIGILIDGEYSLGFKVVHAALMTVSLTLSVLAARQLRLRR